MKRFSEDHSVRFAIVGMGRIAASHLEALALTAEAQVTAIVEPRRAAGVAAAEQKGCRWFESHDDPQLLDLVDAVLICTPPHLHFPVARYFIEHNRHVLCEKPFTLTAGEARTLIALADQRGLLTMMASKFRYVDDVIKAKALLESGVLGKPMLFENTFFGKVRMKDRWNSDSQLSGGGVLIDNGTHSVDIARYLLGPISEIQAQRGVGPEGLDVEESAHVQFRTAGGVIGTVNLSWSINAHAAAYITVYGSEGTLVVEWQGSRYRTDAMTGWQTIGSGYQKTLALKRQFENFIDTLKGRAVPLIGQADALASVEVIEAAYAALSANKWQPVGGRP